jgi:hypothetical protein
VKDLFGLGAPGFPSQLPQIEPLSPPASPPEKSQFEAHNQATSPLVIEANNRPDLVVIRARGAVGGFHFHCSAQLPRRGHRGGRPERISLFRPPLSLHGSGANRRAGEKPVADMLGSGELEASRVGSDLSVLCSPSPLRSPRFW